METVETEQFINESEWEVRKRSYRGGQPRCVEGYPLYPPDVVVSSLFTTGIAPGKRVAN